MSGVEQKYTFENGTVPREPLSARERMMLDALELALDELHEANLARRNGNLPRNPQETVRAEVAVRAVIASVGKSS